MKRCTKCRQLKKEKLFYKNKNYKSGYHIYCKECSDYDTKKYNRTKKGYVSFTYHNQKNSSKTRNHPLPNYSQEELKQWLFSQKKFHRLFKEWKVSEYDRYVKPSIDRIDDNKPYTLDNIQLMTWKDNEHKAKEDMKNGILIQNKQTPVIQMNMKGKQLKVFHSQGEASRQTGIRQSYISRVCLGQRNHTNGYKWKFVS